MSKRESFKLSAVAVLVANACAMSSMAQAEDASPIVADKVGVVSTTPLPSLGVPLEQVPASIQLITGPQMTKQRSVTIADYLQNNIAGVNVNDTQNNPFQPDISFRGYSASPLLGTPQGLSVYVDGVRVNEPFGDVVSWDLIPVNAISNMSLIPGSNPLFGLNTLGGALSLQTKNGRDNQGAALEASVGSWGRKTGSVEYGVLSDDGAVDFFITANSFREDGWRDYSPTDVRQMFAKVGWQNETSRLELSYTGADNDMIGNGLTPSDMLRTLGRDTILTRPDQTRNTMSFINLNGYHWFNDDVMLSGNVYFRHSNTRTLNGDGNDDVDDDEYLADCSVADDDEMEEACGGALNRSRARKESYGFNTQLSFNQNLFEKKNQFIVGFGYDEGKTSFSQSTEFGNLNASRGIDGIGEFNDEGDVKLTGRTRTWSLFATDTLSLNDFWHLTLSARYNYTTVKNRDKLEPSGPESLSGYHTYNRINPAIGLNFTPTKDWTFYGSYNEGSRAPTAIELGCANPDEPCKLPNAMAGDPPLKQVVAKTYEAGLRGNLAEDLRWTASVYRAQNTDDIQFIYANATNGMGYFDNVGKTRRMGFDTNLMGNQGDFNWTVGYSYIKATYESNMTLANEVNTSADNDVISVRKGDRLAGIPAHRLKFRGEYAITPQWSVGANVMMYSDQYAHGNENNKDQGEGAKLGGYTIVNLDTRYNFGNGWQLFAKAINIFDREYSSGGMIGESYFLANGAFDGGEDHRASLRAPGAPRAGWVGVRWEFGGPKN
ncbi:Outer membrane receptor proteins, mostly Fe transport [Methylobacillus rhizosphaerae]|uniref:Outer membrane receptor proteins, mostly Fe transport n=1 Tax=Methylobacillus rhizosphaerae TaxID=551994 RepID=A0A239AW57_9PROT|nr:TonB-dependent receptor [Methylobacillus rhizosphaerae]SNR99800.1 Outer membrane receptor proteins, mostly Fe transport [Methylobacillus rhizosphaerae]